MARQTVDAIHAAGTGDVVVPEKQLENSKGEDGQGKREDEFSNTFRAPATLVLWRICAIVQNDVLGGKRTRLVL